MARCPWSRRHGTTGSRTAGASLADVPDMVLKARSSLAAALVMVVGTGCSTTTHVRRSATTSDLDRLAAYRSTESLVITTSPAQGTAAVTGKLVTTTPARIEIKDLSSGERLWITNDDVQQVTARKGWAPNAAEGAAFGMLIGAVVGAIVGVQTYSRPPSTCWGCLDGLFGPEAAAVSMGWKVSLVGGVVGALIGSSSNATEDYVFVPTPKVAGDQRVLSRTLDAP